MNEELSENLTLKENKGEELLEARKDDQVESKSSENELKDNAVDHPISECNKNDQSDLINEQKDEKDNLLDPTNVVNEKPNSNFESENPETEEEFFKVPQLPKLLSKNEKQSPDSNQSDEGNNEVDKSYENYISYTEDGNAIYTDPKTAHKYKWSLEENKWVALHSLDGSSGNNPYENEHYRWCSESQKWIPKNQVTETDHYRYDFDKKEWVPKLQTKESKTAETLEAVYGLDESGQRTKTDADGTVFFWDIEKKAWFPKIDDDFMARYQMNYGFIDNTSEQEEERKIQNEREAKRREEELKKMAEEAKRGAEEAAAGRSGFTVKRKAQEPPKWFDVDPTQNTKVYVWNLPFDMDLEEFAELMGKCGMIMRDPQTQKYKLKLYSDSNGENKGDGLCDYIKVESVDLALKILDEYNYRGHKIRVQRAQFQMRGEYNPALKPKRKKKDKEKLQKLKEKLFDWRPEKMRGERSKNEKVVIIKNLFDPKIFEKEVQLILDYQNDLREECKKCGVVRKVVIYDRHSEGIAQVNMASIEEADLVIQMMHGRFFGQRKLEAEHWDGKTKYKSFESQVEEQSRLSNWDKFLEEDDLDDDDGDGNHKDEERNLEEKGTKNLRDKKTDEMFVQ